MNQSHDNSSSSIPAQVLPLRRNFFWYTAQQIARPIFALWFRLRARGVEHVPLRSGALFVINHQSFLDPMFVGAAIPRPVSYLARDSLFRVPGIGWWLRHTYVIPINRESAGTGSIRAAVDRLRQGYLVGIFPEGTRSTGGKLGRLKPGFVALVRRAKVPVIPVGVAGTGDAMPRGAWFIRPRTCRVVYGRPLTPVEVESFCQHGREEELVSLIRERMQQCLEEADAWRLGKQAESRNEAID